MSFLYKFVKYYGRVALPLYFGKLEINGRENVPKNAPFIYAPNHINAFLDAVIIGVYSKKDVHFLTRSDVFVKPYIWMLEGLNMLPVYRIRDGYEQLKKNDHTFDTCFALLKEGKPVLIFPEGNLAGVHFLRPLTKGISRLSFQAQEKQDEDVYVVPVGLNYFHPNHPRRKLIINFGEPIRVRDYDEMLSQNKAKALKALRDNVHLGISNQLILSKEEDLQSSKRFILNKENENLNFNQLRAKSLEADELKPETNYPNLRPLVILLSVPNFIPLLSIRYILKKLKDKQFINSIKFAIGAFALPIWWLILFILCAAFSSVQTGLLVVFIAVGSIFVRQFVQNLCRA